MRRYFDYIEREARSMPTWLVTMMLHVNGVVLAWVVVYDAWLLQQCEYSWWLMAQDIVWLPAQIGVIRVLLRGAGAPPEVRVMIYELAPINLNEGDRIEIMCERAMQRIREQIELSARAHSAALLMAYWSADTRSAHRLEIEDFDVKMRRWIAEGEELRRSRYAAPFPAKEWKVTCT